MPESKAIVKKRFNWAILIAVIGGVLILGLMVILGTQYLIPKLLTLKPGETIRGKITIDAPGPFHVGDLIPVTVTIESKTGITFKMPDFAGANFGALEIKEKSNPVLTKLQGGQIQKVSWLLTGWEIGTYRLPELIVNYLDSNNKPGVLQIPSRNLAIVSLLPKNKTVDELLKLDIKGLKGPVGLPPRLTILWWFIGGIALVIIVWLLVRIFYKPKAEALTGDLIPLEPAHIIAFRRLEAIQNADYLTNGDFKTFYSELSECAREYMENRFQIRALEMTTEEFLIYVSGNNCLKFEFQMILKEFLKFSDLVKFAKHLPLIEEADRSTMIIRQFIDATKEIPAETIDPAIAANQNNHPGEQLT